MKHIVSIHLKKLQSQECTNRISTKTLFTGPCDVPRTPVYIGRFREVPFSITLLINWVILKRYRWSQTTFLLIRLNGYKFWSKLIFTKYTNMLLITSTFENIVSYFHPQTTNSINFGREFLFLGWRWILRLQKCPNKSL